MGYLEGVCRENWAPGIFKKRLLIKANTVYSVFRACQMHTTRDPGQLRRYDSIKTITNAPRVTIQFREVNIRYILSALARGGQGYIVDR